MSISDLKNGYPGGGHFSVEAITLNHGFSANTSLVQTGYLANRFYGGNVPTQVSKSLTNKHVSLFGPWVSGQSK